MTAIGVAAGAGAAQLGLAYGLGIVNWLPQAAGEAWTASSAWAVWIAAASTVVGAVCAGRVARVREASDAAGEASSTAASRPATLPVLVRRIALAVAAVAGALVTVALVAVPARFATDTGDLNGAAAGYTAAGLAVGLVLAFWALSSRPAANNLIATIAWLWLIGIGVAIVGIVSKREPLGARLGVWHVPPGEGNPWLGDDLHWLGAALSLGAAVLIGAVAARRAARRPEGRVGAAASGAAGPLLVAAAHLIVAPRLTEFGIEQFSAHLTVAYATIAGAAGSGLMAALAQRADTRARLAAPPTENPAPPMTDPAAAPTKGDAAPSTKTKTKIKQAVVPAQPSGPPSDGESAPSSEPAEISASGEPRRKSRRLGGRRANREAEATSSDGSSS